MIKWTHLKTEFKKKKNHLNKYNYNSACDIKLLLHHIE